LVKKQVFAYGCRIIEFPLTHLPFGRRNLEQADTWTAAEYRQRVRFAASLLQDFQAELGDAYQRYAVIQILATGLSNTNIPPDLPLQIGWHIFNRGEETHGCAYFNWLTCQAIRSSWLTDRIEHMRRDVEYRDGGPTGFRFNLPQEAWAAAADPVGMLGQIYSLLMDLIAGDCTLIGHSLWGFTLSILQANFNFWFKKQLPLTSPVLDTALVEKAIQLQFGYPWVEEDLDLWQDRICRTKGTGSIRWNLPLTLARWGLDSRYGIDLRQTYNADYDALAVHCLFQELLQVREMCYGPIQNSGGPTPGNQAPWY